MKVRLGIACLIAAVPVGAMTATTSSYGPLWLLGTLTLAAIGLGLVEEGSRPRRNHLGSAYRTVEQQAAIGRHSDQSAHWDWPERG